MIKVFDISTLQGLERAELFKQEMENCCHFVDVQMVGLEKVCIQAK